MKSLRALRPTSRLALLIGLVAMIAAGAVAFAADPQPAIQTIDAAVRASRSPTSTCCASRSATTTATRSAPGCSRPDSNYAQGGRVGRRRGGSAGSRPRRRPRSQRPTKAIVLDVDDTTLATWNYEIFSNWAFNPTTNANFVTEQQFPAVPGMVDMVQRGRARGLRDLLPDRPAGRAGERDARQPDRPTASASTPATRSPTTLQRTARTASSPSRPSPTTRTT